MQRQWLGTDAKQTTDADVNASLAGTIRRTGRPAQFQGHWAPFLLFIFAF